MQKKDYWYKRAVFYELNVRGFCDVNGDGVGDIAGVTAKLDYLSSLGVDVIWLLPITKSPLRDGGYDVIDMMDVNPSYGSLDDFTELVEAAHSHDMRIMVELIPNHTSDQHPWFQASRDPTHPDHEKYKDYYVWSDTDQKYTDTRIIFTDYEKSNWEYDPVRGQFYWHRFFYHQPDLNYDNPEVQREMMRVIQFWIDAGADAIRVDAPPYLIEREGTNCENLPETHAYFKRLRSFVESYSPDTMLLAEANQMPEDTLHYFGKGDEFHMNFHFPLMPRLYMALAMEDRTPIEKILARTPELPKNCQWGVFLRCHDELTLEMVSPEEREFMLKYYAPDPRMELKLGIRRRLAPLLENDQRRIRLMHAILLSFLGSPVLYYGDEIGMGDNIELDDRDGVRTPMQWDDTANGGFSTADPGQIRIPPLEDPIYGYLTVNVAASETAPGSLLNWLRMMIKLRKDHPVFGEGSLQLLAPPNRKILAYLRKNKEERILVLINLSPDPQELNFTDLAISGNQLNDLVTYEDPIEVKGHPIIIDSYGFHWYKVE
jgi:maltose alpha-D-glucosyltransferase/alpha-amylase